MKTKILLPVLAIVFAVGLVFATNNLNLEANKDYILNGDDQWVEIPEQDCGLGSLVCQVTVRGEGPFNVYDQKNPATLKLGDGTINNIP